MFVLEGKFSDKQINGFEKGFRITIKTKKTDSKLNRGFNNEKKNCYFHYSKIIIIIMLL